MGHICNCCGAHQPHCLPLSWSRHWVGVAPGVEKERIKPCSHFSILLLPVSHLLLVRLHFISFLSRSSSSLSYAVSYLSASLLVPIAESLNVSTNLQSENKFHCSSFYNCSNCDYATRKLLGRKKLFFRKQFMVVVSKAGRLILRVHE